MRITGAEHALHVRRVLAIDDDVLARIERNTELIDEWSRIGTREPEREDQRIDRHAQLGALDLGELAVADLDTNAMQRDGAAGVTLELGRAECERATISSRHVWHRTRVRSRGRGCRT